MLFRALPTIVALGIGCSMLVGSAHAILSPVRGGGDGMGAFDWAPYRLVSSPLDPHDTGSLTDRRVLIEQVGDDNDAVVTQAGRAATASIVQKGDRNEARIDQSSAATSEARIDQYGSTNVASLIQRGDGANQGSTMQTGHGNAVVLRQTASGGFRNDASIVQAGSSNQMNVTQADSNNTAVLAQYGDGNAMTANQEGVGNALTWTQTGNHLSDLNITQSGASAMTITQSRLGK